MTTTDPIATIPTADLERMRQAAWREAAQAWQYYRAHAKEPGVDLLWNAAESAESYWKHLDRELLERAS